MVESGPDVAHLGEIDANDVQATFCATLVDQWVERGVRHAVIAPGSRSTPLALAVVERSELSAHVVHDERVAAFIALGIAVDSDIPALLICTSGTAAANFFPAVVEANLSAVPMLVLTADRPTELRGVGAPQTIDQIDLYGSHVRWFYDPDVPTAERAGTWRPLADTAMDRAGGGPVHLNLPFREPLLGQPGPLPDAGLVEFGESRDAGLGADDRVPDGFDQQRGVILAGGRSGIRPADVIALHERTEWPIIADPQSGLRSHPGTIVAADALLRHEGVAVDLAPSVVVRVGRPSTSKVVSRWTAGPDVVVIQVGGPGLIDPDRNVTARCSIGALIAAGLSGAVGTTWLRRWRHADRLADEAIGALLEVAELGEAGVARLVGQHRPADAHVTVASSMPIRDLEWFGGRRAIAHANRGANGIDGVISTALGRTLAGEGPGIVLVGDIAFVHDSNALVGLLGRGVDLRVIVVDNDGGGIFSFLPQSTELAPETFEQLFGTPHGVDVLSMTRSCGVEAVEVITASDLIEQLDRPGPWVAQVSSDRRANLHQHHRLNEAVIRALDF